MIEQKKIIYFVGIGGIGMSALARYFLLQKKTVFGYDATASENTRMLEQLNATIHYDEQTIVLENVLQQYSKDDLLVIYTPAVSLSSPIMQWLVQQKIPYFKRAEVLGEICRSFNTIAVAGTHGKTTISSLIAHILYHSATSCCAFLGGIVKNYDSNFLFNSKSNVVVVEADEYDRSFLTLYPTASVLTAVDPDHLDIYGTYESL